MSPQSGSTCYPFLYIEVMMLMRVLCRPSGTVRDDDGPPPPARIVQFMVRLAGTPAMAALLKMWCSTFQDLRAQNEQLEAEFEEVLFCALNQSWTSHGGKVLSACQEILADLYPDSQNHEHVSSALDIEVSSALDIEVSSALDIEAPSFSSVLVATACQFSMQLLNGVASRRFFPGAFEPSAGQIETNDSAALFSSALHCCSMIRCTTVSSNTSADRFLLCLQDVLELKFGRRKSRADDAAPEADSAASSNATPLDIRALGRVLRLILQAYFIDPTILAARDDELSRARSSGWQESGADVLLAGSFTGPSDPGDFVPAGVGPLRRSLAFMEQSPLLQVVQQKLCTARFDDVEGSTNQLSSFAIRNLRVHWFDLRRSTSTLKRASATTSADLPPAEKKEDQADYSDRGTVTALCLVLRHMKLALSCDYEADVATFPYLRFAGTAQVIVRSLVISVFVDVSSTSGVILQDVKVGAPDLEVNLSNASVFSRIALTSILNIFQATLQDHLQKQLRQNLTQMLQREIDRTNQSTWKFIARLVPESLIRDGFLWINSNLPPEGLPV
eukprot:TRINITY_DN8195_c0_g2_i1.p1 TRINITY_DN8195_c0_g2~~TRINITY_DN8195_c0_g2_i1.p1  ORF type:complete len:560 (+),score=71.11 TRINITY_DN8195_c0_g2_i1:506-2185(+)